MLPSGRRKVLIIDDDDDFGRNAASALEGAGFIARFNHGPQGSLQAIRETSCDVVLLDVNMPQLDGPRLVRMIRETSSAPRVRVILCSNMHKGLLQKLADRLGADGAIQKPEDTQELASALEAALLAEPASRVRVIATGLLSDALRETPARSSGAEGPPSTRRGSDPETGSLDIVIESPDLVVLKARGAVTNDIGKAALSRMEAWARPRPYYLILFDMSETVDLDAAARDQMSAWARRVPPHAMAVFGADFHIQVVLEMVQRAVSKLTGRPLHRNFSRDEAAARAWLDKMRPSLGTGS
ncbi:response regulator [Polyangium jinanense]|uniref:Response regulator n=1 Tax=Polyangium jinanense TaxID=2829994 RepID=A0A9X3X568_9BACT|nr:response regulator [Polyangium jinanense]MDC3955255.1 response regulator [Polyangium jinanense]MDC3981556.1 response regulator [Polyangium jinanense]